MDCIVDQCLALSPHSKKVLDLLFSLMCFSSGYPSLHPSQKRCIFTNKAGHSANLLWVIEVLYWLSAAEKTMMTQSYFEAEQQKDMTPKYQRASPYFFL